MRRWLRNNLSIILLVPVQQKTTGAMNYKLFWNQRPYSIPQKKIIN